MRAQYARARKYRGRAGFDDNGFIQQAAAAVTMSDLMVAASTMLQESEVHPEEGVLLGIPGSMLGGAVASLHGGPLNCSPDDDEAFAYEGPLKDDAEWNGDPSVLQSVGVFGGRGAEALVPGDRFAAYT
jgi:hypothetical protein